MDTVAQKTTEINYADLRAAAGFVRAPVTKAAGKSSRRWAHPLQAPLFYESALGRRGRRKMDFTSSADEWRYKIWATKEAASLEAAAVRRSNPHGLVLYTISRRKERYAIVTVWKGMMSVRIPSPQPGQLVGATRGVITGFSDRSFKRSLERLLQWKPRKPLSGWRFVTLTYPDKFPTDHETVYGHLEALAKRMMRKFPGIEFYWKREYKPRQTGVNKGKQAPHFHLIVSGMPGSIKWQREWLRLAWYQIAHDGDEHEGAAGTQIDQITSRAHAMSYAAKYCSKISRDEETGEIFTTGRWWGWMGKPDFSEELQFRTSLQQIDEWRVFLSDCPVLRSTRFKGKLDRSWLGFSAWYVGLSNEEGVLNYRKFLQAAHEYKPLDYAQNIA